MPSHTISAKGPLRYGLIVVATIWLAQVASPAPAPDTERATTSQITYPVGKVTLEYSNPHAGQPPLAPLMDLLIELSETADGVLAGPGDGEPVRLRLSELSADSPRRMKWSAVLAICSRAVRYLNDQGLIGVHVGPAADQIDVAIEPLSNRPTGGQDLRQAGDTTLHLLARTALVTQVRTVTSGPDAAKPRIDSSPSNPVIRNSPVQPSPSGSPLFLQPLDDYVTRLNRRTYQHVNAALSAGENPDRGDVTLDYLVNESRPWEVLFAISNTGTKQTDPWRERFAFTDQDLTHHDDLLRIDYTTADFNKFNDVSVFYEAPVLGSDKLRFRVNGVYSEYTASDVGIDSAQFNGHETDAGADLVFSLYQHRDLFVDLVGGARYRDITVDGAIVSGHDQFFLPHFGVEVSRYRNTSSLFASLGVEFNVPGVAGTEGPEIDELGRVNAGTSWTVLTWNVSHSVFLEPLLNPAEWAKADVDHPEKSSHWARLAHELCFSTTGQYAFGSRLIPQAEQVAGGFYSVRGYPEASSVGDDVVIGSAEYRYHIPRGLTPQPDPTKTPLFNQPFRYAPQSAYGAPDWDLVFRTFLDAGWTGTNHRESFEYNDTLVGTGVGVELDLKHNVSLRVDWGIALHETHEARAGSNRFHIQAIFAY